MHHFIRPPIRFRVDDKRCIDPTNDHMICSGKGSHGEKDEFQSPVRPKTAAVIGVSLTNNLHLGNVIYHKNNLRYPANVFAVNPKGGTLQGQEVFSQVKDIPEKIDLAVIAARAKYCPKILSECIEAGVVGAVVISGGFAEFGNHDLQNQLISIAKTADLPFIGPI